VFWGKLLKQYFLLSGDDGEMQERRGRARIYLYGVLCHYTLDSTCHAFIDETERTGVTTHAELEGDYDRRLIAAEGRDPVCEVLTRRFHPSREAAEAIAALYPEVTADIVEKTLHSCVSFQRLVLCRHAWKRNLIFTALRLIGKYDSLHPHIMNKEPDPDCREAEEKLDEFYREALPKAVSLITELDRCLEAFPDEVAMQQCRIFTESTDFDRDFCGMVPQKEK